MILLVELLAHLLLQGGTLLGVELREDGVDHGVVLGALCY
jgi:hypothetical protein